MRRFAQDTTEQVVEALGSHMTQGLNVTQISSLRTVHGLNKLQEEEKVKYILYYALKLIVLIIFLKYWFILPYFSSTYIFYFYNFLTGTYRIEIYWTVQRSVNYVTFRICSIKCISWSI